MKDYTHPVTELLTCGRPDNIPDWGLYVNLGIGEQHIPELICLATDLELLKGELEGAEIWAPHHAWRVLGQLAATDAIEPLIDLIKDLDGNDWAIDELPRTFGMIGPTAILPLTDYLCDDSNPELAGFIAADSLKEIGLRHAIEKENCIGSLSEYLYKASVEYADLNGIVVSALIDLDAKSAIDSIRQAFNRDIVSLGVAGDLEDVEIELGLREKRETELPFNSVRALRKAKESERTVKVKIGRNELCPCGSGKKYKKCCLK